MAKTLIVFPACLDSSSLMAKSHVAGYTRKDGVFVKEHDDKRKATSAPARSNTSKTKKAPAASSAVKTKNEGWGFHGAASESYIRGKHGPDFDHSNASSKDISDAKSHADKQFQGAADHLVQAKHFDNHEQARDFLDSRYGRHSHDESGPDGDISKNRWLSHYVKLHKKEAGMDSTAKTGSKSRG